MITPAFGILQLVVWGPKLSQTLRWQLRGCVHWAEAAIPKAEALVDFADVFLLGLGDLPSGDLLHCHGIDGLEIDGLPGFTY